MQFSIAAVLAAATAVSAGSYGYPSGGNVTYVTEVVTAYTTYCPEATTLTYGDKTYTITEATTLTITDCPCTISKPVITSSVVECHDCAKPTETPVAYPPAPPPAAQNSTLVYVPTTPAGAEPSAPPTTNGAGKAVAMSGAGLAGVLGLAAFFL